MMNVRNSPHLCRLESGRDGLLDTGKSPLKGPEGIVRFNLKLTAFWYLVP